jgi:Leucine-rich repeat (LRR) protein
MFDAACKVPNLEGLYIKWSGIKDISALRNANHLTHLHVGSSSQIESIEVLGGLRDLITLDLEQLNKISDFGVLAKLAQLEGLGLDGSMWTPQTIDTLEPIGQLRNLRYFTATNSIIKTNSFEPLLKLKNLVRFDCSWNYPEQEFEKLKSLPNLKYGNIKTSWKEIKARIKKA